MLEVTNITKSFDKDGARQVVLSDLSLEIGAREFVCLLGPSGCGKSTLLRIMAGLDQAEAGTVHLDDRLVKEPQPKCAFVFQDYALFPWKTVLENVVYGMDVQGMYDKTTRVEKAREYLKLMHLENYENSYIHELSGGMRQRTAIARSLALEPEILFMDEPFGALDNFTRMELQELLLDIYRKNKLSVVFVTHDISEAIYLGDRVVVMNAHPGTIHSILEINRGLVADRTSEDFHLYEDRIMQAFQLVRKQEIEYYI
ncbi:MAG: ABC transporter ATP-binding protein [Anaerovibrio sp.]|nr:ABC transporter ATP-binding protein [Anaerovibrio sp.]